MGRGDGGARPVDGQSVAAGFGPVCAMKFGLVTAYKTAESVLDHGGPNIQQLPKKKKTSGLAVFMKPKPKTWPDVKPEPVTEQEFKPKVKEEPRATAPKPTAKTDYLF